MHVAPAKDGRAARKRKKNWRSTRASTKIARQRLFLRRTGLRRKSYCSRCAYYGSISLYSGFEIRQTRARPYRLPMHVAIVLAKQKSESKLCKVLVYTIYTVHIHTPRRQLRAKSRRRNTISVS